MLIIPKYFTNGTYDILTPAHVSLLKYAGQFWDLVVAIDSDRRVKEKKGNERPYFNQEERKLMLESIKYVWKVFIFDTDQELEDIIKKYKPDVMVVGSDWEGKNVIGSQYAKKLEFFPRDERYSTTKILKGIKPNE